MTPKIIVNAPALLGILFMPTSQNAWIFHVELAPDLGNPGSKNQTKM